MKLYVVDDDLLVLRSLCRDLRRGGLEPEAFSHPLMVVAAAQLDPPDLLVADLNMPGLTGIELVRSMKLLHPRLRAGIVTAYASAISREDLALCDFVFEKPWDRDTLVAAIRNQERLQTPGGAEHAAVKAS